MDAKSRDDALKAVLIARGITEADAGQVRSACGGPEAR
jgi:hypothetical protein